MIGFDADDTLWHSEDGFLANEQRFVELIAPYAPEGVAVKEALTATERKNLSTFGYGVKSFGLSMVEAAVTISGGRVPSTVVAEMVEMVRGQLDEPVRLLDHVPEVLAEVGATRRMILITKGDLIHQTHKVTTSGLAHHFEHVEIVLEKDPETYAEGVGATGHRPDPVLHGRQQRAQRHLARAGARRARRARSVSDPVGPRAGRSRRTLRRTGLACRPPRLARPVEVNAMRDEAGRKCLIALGVGGFVEERCGAGRLISHRTG